MFKTEMRTHYGCGLVLLAYAVIITPGVARIHYAATKPNYEWWSNTIMYQVYPRSFKDSNKDGIGDLKGITQKLDHFVDLGIETLWIGPFFKSPMDDLGYDVEDFKMIDPVFGTMEDFEELVSEMKKRNLKFVTDIIPNHSSYKSEWFKKSIKRIGKYENYYVWRNASNQHELTNSSITPLPPNNWLNVFGGTAWTWNKERKQFYYHQFSPKQADFNIRNPDVQNEILDIMKFWMTKGINGFRFDAVKHLFEADTLEDEPYLPGKENSLAYFDMRHIYTVDQPEVYEIINQWREFMDNFTAENNSTISCIMASESYSDIDIIMQYYGSKRKPGVHIPFNFGLLLEVDRNNFAESIDSVIKSWLDNIPENMVANWVIENHDNQRIPAKFGPEMVPIFTALKLVLPGIDVTYYGSEIGMDNTFVRRDQLQDPNGAGRASGAEPRDFERCPMQWDSSINAGFTEEKKSWLPVNPNYYKVNVEEQKKIPNSNYNFYKKMAQLRKTSTLKRGDLQTFNITKSIYILKRSLDQHESYIVVINFGSEVETVVLSNVMSYINDTLYVYLASKNAEYFEGNTVSPTTSFGNQLHLRPQSVVVLTDKFIKPKEQPHHDHPTTEQPCTKHQFTERPPTDHDHYTNDSIQFSSKLMYLLGALLLTKFIV